MEREPTVPFDNNMNLTQTGKWTDTSAIKMAGVGIVAVTTIFAGKKYLKKHFGVYDKKLIYVMRGKVTGDLKTEVGSSGTKVSCITDLHGYSKYENLNEDYKDDKYTFFEKKASNPEISYTKKDNMTVIQIGLRETDGSKMQNMGYINRPKALFPGYDFMAGKANRIASHFEKFQKVGFVRDSSGHGAGHAGSTVQFNFEWYFKVIIALGFTIVVSIPVMVWKEQFHPGGYDKTENAKPSFIHFCKGNVEDGVYLSTTEDGSRIELHYEHGKTDPNDELPKPKFEKEYEHNDKEISYFPTEKKYYKLLNITMIKVSHSKIQESLSKREREQANKPWENTKRSSTY